MIYGSVRTVAAQAKSMPVQQHNLAGVKRASAASNCATRLHLDSCARKQRVTKHHLRVSLKSLDTQFGEPFVGAHDGVTTCERRHATAERAHRMSESAPQFQPRSPRPWFRTASTRRLLEKLDFLESVFSIPSSSSDRSDQPVGTQRVLKGKKMLSESLEVCNTYFCWSFLCSRFFGQLKRLK